jgi:hypothetical protein
MDKIVIRGPYEKLSRISIFLDNNHIEYDMVGDLGHGHATDEIRESIDWPF